MARRLWATVRTPTGFAGAVVLLVVLFFVIAGPIIWGPRAARIDPLNILAPPSARHPLGTDSLGRDVMSEVFTASRLSLELSVLATLVGAGIGVPLGSMVAILSPRPRRIVGSLINFTVGFPALLTAIFLSVIVGVGATGAVLAIGLSSAPSFARLSQALASSITEMDYLSAARLLGVSRTRQLFRHVLANIGEPIILNVTMSIGGALVALSSLSFLGLGVQPPSYDWGKLLADGLANIYTNPTQSIGPGVAIVIAGIGFNLFGESFAQALGHRVTQPKMALGRRRRRVVLPGGHRRAMEPSRGVEIATPVPDGAETGTPAVLHVEGLSVAFPRLRPPALPVRGVSFDVGPGEIVGLAGESGSGKSLTALAIAQLLPPGAHATAARLEFLGENLLARRGPRADRALGTTMAMVFQDPMTSLNPALRVGVQLSEVAEVHHGMRRRDALRQAADRLRAVRIARPAERLRQHPHEFSGGMRQRAVIAMGLMGEPRLFLADEPTTALDTTVQRQVLGLFRELSVSTHAAMLLVSHDVAVLGELCSRVMFMYGGMVMEDLPVGELRSARNPYARMLVAAVPDLRTARDYPLASIQGQPPAPDALPKGCPFAPRCPRMTQRCQEEVPVPDRVGDGHLVACFNPLAPEESLVSEAVGVAR
ncbi:MAG: dipeptide/oligopeptide/nickel ABC transporter permease/ATP-binding protein [Acidimicrobiales bacterium]